jgi:hypothetical protein
MAEWSALMFYILMALNLFLGLKAGYLDRGFAGFLQSFQTNAGTVT